MTQKTGRNDPCVCGSGKKFKSCCWSKHQSSRGKKFTAKVLSGGAKGLFGRAMAASAAPVEGESASALPKMTALVADNHTKIQAAEQSILAKEVISASSQVELQS